MRHAFHKLRTISALLLGHPLRFRSATGSAVGRPAVGWSLPAARHSRDMESVFVTVGTTSFDHLIEEVSSEKAIQILQELGYRKLILQIGRGSVEPKPSVGTNFTVEFYRFKDTIADDIRNATLVISHAGAGSCLEILEAGKPLIVVINEKLMNNHQLELAKQLHCDGHLLYCSCSTLCKTLQKLDCTSLKPFPSGHPERFAAFMDNVLGFQ